MKNLNARALWLLGIVALACTQQPVDPLVEIQRLQQAGQFASSVAPLRELLDRDPSNAEANFLLGTALMQTGDSGVAVWPLRRASEAPEYAVEANLLLAQAMLESRTAADAIEAVDRVLAIEPDHVGALALRVRTLMADGAIEEALAEIDRVLELDPDNLAVLVPRVTGLIATEKIAEAEVALETARMRIANAQERVPPGMQARLCIAGGMFAFEKGEQQTAESLYAECLEKFPTDPLVVTESVEFHDRIGERERATEILKNAAESPEGGAFRVALARRLGALGSPMEEERLLREAAEQNPSLLSWFTLADFLVRRGDFGSAITSFEKAMALRSDPPAKLRFAYADTLIQAGRYDDALGVAAGLEQQELRELIRGRALLARGDPQGALAAFEAGIRLWPNNAAGRFFAGVAAERIGDFERAVSEYRESIRADAAQTSAGLELARLYFARGQLDDAMASAGRYVRSHQTDPEGYLIIIRIAHQTGSKDVVADGLRRLRELRGQTAVAAAEEATLISSGRGPAPAVEAIERSGLDLSDSDNAPVLRAMLAQLALLGEVDRASALVKAALNAAPDEAVFHEFYARLLLASDSTQARAAFERAVALDANAAGALAGLAELAAAGEDWPGAVAGYERAAAADPEAPEFGLAAAEALLQSGEPEQARARLERVLESHPREATAMLVLARSLADAGQFDLAIELATRAEWFRAPDAVSTRLRIQERRAAAAAQPTDA